ncbi:MAG: TIGR01777 family protein [Planctomycetes bacterium]|nr:TIGR01777 family protein [Planctomycetota bacterium]
MDTRETPPAPRTILVTGASGLIGSALVRRLRAEGHRVRPLVRRPPREAAEIAWDPAKGWLDPRELEGADAVVHLAGENIAGGRWTAERKRVLDESRRRGTGLLAATLAQLEHPPAVLVSASAVGYYGDTGEEVVDERASSGAGFLPEVCRHWEAAAAPARDAGLRVVHPRIGVVLAADGGALAKMLTPFKLGLGGRLGSGRQWMSWISLDDVVSVLHAGVFDERLSGPVNAVAPTPVRNDEFTAVLGRVLGRPTVAPVPAFALRALVGELADELLLASLRVEPRALEQAGFAWEHATLEGALRAVLHRAA